MKKLIPQLLGFTLPKPTKTVYTVLRQLVQWIPPGMIQRLADGHKLDIRKWSAVSHVVALMYGQLAGCDSLNGTVDAARVHEGEWRNIRGAQPSKRNTFSNANLHRDAAMAERLYWEVFEHLVSVCPGFGQYKRHKGFLARMKRGIFAIDSSTIRLCLNCIDWARHRRKKAAAKLHMNLDVGSRLPAFAVVEDAGHHDSTRAKTLCAGLKAGDVCLADRAYTDFSFLDGLRVRGVFFVVRQKTNMRLKRVRRLPESRTHPTLRSSPGRRARARPPGRLRTPTGKTSPPYAFRRHGSTPGVRKPLPGLPRSLTRRPELDRSAVIQLRRILHHQEKAAYTSYPSVEILCPRIPRNSAHPSWA